MNDSSNKRLTPFSQKLRREMTEEERRLWYDFLRGLPITFNRQKVIGHYIVDFYCAKAKLVIELDGSQHGEKEAVEKDKERDAYLNSRGLTVLRYTNLQIKRNFKEVCSDIFRRLPLKPDEDRK